jgi:HK97 family phage portal protein
MSIADSFKSAFQRKKPEIAVVVRKEPTLSEDLMSSRNVGPINAHRGYLSDSRIQYSQIARGVSFDRAMTLSAVFACIKLLTESVSTLPIEMYSKSATGERKQVFDHPLIKLLRNKPNSRQTRVEFFESLMVNLLSGNAYIKKGYFKKDLVSLEVINSGSVQPILQPNGVMQYKYSDENYQIQTFTTDEIWHIKLFGNGLVGMSPISYGAKAMGIGLALDDKVGRVMENGAKPSGTLSTEKSLKKEQRDALRTEMDGLMNGDDTFLPVLEGGLTYQTISLTPTDIQLLDSRRFAVQEVCRFFGVPGILINDSSDSTKLGSSIDSIIEAFYKFGLRPYLERIEESIRLNLLPRSDWDKFEFEFQVTALLRASPALRVAGNKTRIESGQATINEVRIEEGKPPVVGGDVTIIPVNLSTLDRVISGQTSGATSGNQPNPAA